MQYHPRIDLVTLVFASQKRMRFAKYFKSIQSLTIMNAMSYLIFSGMGPFSFLLEADAARMWSGLLMAACGGRKRDAVEALIMKHGAEAGLGRGFVSGSLMNFRAIVNMVAPVLLSRIYALGSKRGRPELVFLFGALSSVTAECVWQSLSNVQLGLDRKGHAFKKDDGSERHCTT